jgi:hypothetical protein
MAHSFSAGSRLKAWVVVGALLLGAGAGLLAGACSGDSESNVLHTGAGAAGNAGGGGGHGGEGNLFGGNGGYAAVVSIQITPADPVIVVDNGVIPAPTVFTAVGITGSGDTVPVSGTWSYDRYDLGSIDSMSGSFTAAGLLGGTGTVTFATPDVSGTTTATVKLHLTSDPQSVDPSIKALFAAASLDDPAMTLLYPYDKTVFPRGLPGPVLQWNGGAATDIYYVHAYGPAFEFEGWGTVPPPSRYTFPAAPSDVWRVLTDSTTGAITLDVQRYDGGQAYLPKTETWTVAPANLAGIVYYWSISAGNVVRIPIGASAPESFIPLGGHACVACHSVSAQGNRIVAAYDGSRSPWATFDAATGVEEYFSNQASGFEAISPDGSYVVYRHWNEAMASDGFLILSRYNDSTPLANLNPGVGYPVHPAWSPDGTKIVFGDRTDGANALYFTQSTLWIADVDVNAPAFSNIHQIVANDANSPTLTYGTFSPGSDWIAFMRGNQAYCNSGSMGYVVNGDIWLASLDGSTQINLDALNGHGIVASPDDNLNYTPSFLPVTVGGYMWLVFATERNYGNMIQYASNDVLPRPKQLWVAAIDPSPQGGQDPSHPAFWLPGQELGTENMRGQWALAPCKQLGEECNAGYECCDGFCRADDGGHPVCQNQPGPCSQSGEACDTASDCCDPGAQCIGGYCNTPPPT